MLDAPVGPGGEDVLSQPSRARAFALLAELKRPAKTAELAEQLRMHPNGVRIHLERLQEAGLVDRVRVRQGRGRPADAWTIASEARPSGQPPRAYRDLSRWLARAIRQRSATRAGLERAGRQIGRELAPTDVEAGLEALQGALAALGFAPSMEAGGADEVTIRLGNCPYCDVVRENQPAICALHKGITRGLLDVLAPELRLSAFVPHDPEQAGCVVGLRPRS